MKRKILLAEDDPSLANTLGFYLKKSGFDVYRVEDGKEAIQQIKENSYSLVILDVDIPYISGFEVCKVIRGELKLDIPIIFLTALADEIDRILGIELGGDDYLTKPFSSRELLARINRLLSRIEKTTVKKSKWKAEENKLESISSSSKETSTTISAKCSLKYCDESKLLYLNGETIRLTAIEQGILRTLLARPKRVFSRDELMNQSYQGFTVVNERTIDSHIRKIRKQFEKFKVNPIETIHGMGYQLSPKLLEAPRYHYNSHRYSSSEEESTS